METDIQTHPPVTDQPEENKLPAEPETPAPQEPETGEPPQAQEQPQSPTLRPLGLFEMLRYENTRHADPANIKTDKERDATSRVLSRSRRSVWDI